MYWGNHDDARHLRIWTCPESDQASATVGKKAIASKSFDAALERELHELIQEAKRMASQIKRPSHLSFRVLGPRK